MDRFHLMTVFVAVAEAQSFSAAARRLELSPPAVTRAVSALEKRLGVQLLHRTTRIVQCTEVGERYLHDVRKVLLELQAAEESASGAHGVVQGRLSVTAPVMFGRLHVAPILIEYCDQYPSVNAEAVFVDRVVNLIEEGVDVGIRIGDLPDSTMRAIPVGEVRHVVCASPAYLEHHGIPQAPEDLLTHAIVMSTAGDLSSHWQFGSKIVKLKPRLTTNSNDTAIQAAVAGAGITRVLSYQVQRYLADGALRVVLSNYEPTALPVNLVHQQGRNLSARLRAFLDFAVPKLRSVLGQN